MKAQVKIVTRNRAACANQIRRNCDALLDYLDEIHVANESQKFTQEDMIAIRGLAEKIFKFSCEMNAHTNILEAFEKGGK